MDLFQVKVEKNEYIYIFEGIAIREYILLKYTLFEVKKLNRISVTIQTFSGPDFWFSTCPKR
jgi:hypothetical protein